VALWALSYSYCYSDIITSFGATGNAADMGLQWSMVNTLPDASQPNITVKVNGLIYQYTITKDVNDAAIVTVANQDAINGGNIFQEQDNWSGVPGNSIKKVFTFAGVDSTRWGDGSITVDGTGTISNARVVYTYRMDVDDNMISCIVPLSSPTCPGFYAALLDYFKTIEYVQEDDPYYDEWVQYQLQKKAELETETDVVIEEVASEEPDLEVQMFGENRMSDLVDTAEQALMLAQLSQVATINPYYNVTISGGEYQDVAMLQDANLPDNTRVLRNLASDEAHTAMVRSQYDREQ
jgi:hypothetical protein